MADLTISGLRALLDADPDIHSLVVGDGLLRELLDAAAERDEALRRVAELEVALEPHGARRLELAQKLAISASNLLRIERDDARRQVAELETDAVELEDRVAELEGLLVQAEDYARDAALEAAADTADSTTLLVVTDAMVQAAIDGALDLAYESFPGPDGQDTHRQHDAHEGVRDELGGYDSRCPLCRVAGSHPNVAGPARLRVFRAALEAALAVGPWRTGTPPEATP